MRRLLSLTLTAAVATTALADHHKVGEKKTVAMTAAGLDDFSTLVAAVKAAGLLEALNDPAKKVTVFAPTNDAFDKLPEGTVDDLLKPENKAKLKAVLTLHVVEGPVSAKDFAASGTLKSLQGTTLKLKDGAVVGGTGDPAKLVKTDVEASNGMIHVIDTVLLP